MTSTNECCVCLKQNSNLYNLREKDESNVSILLKLQSCIAEIEWLSSYKICEHCFNLLKTVYNFREICIKSDTIRKQQLNDLAGNDRKQQIKSEDGQYDCSSDNNNYDDDDEDNDATYSSEGDDQDKYQPSIKPKRSNSANNENVTDDDENDEDCDDEYRSLPKRKRKNFAFKCDRCLKIFSSKRLFVQHCVNEHGMDTKNIRPFVCTQCNSSFGTSSNLVQHIKYHEAVRSHVCSYCGKGYITKTDLKVHEKHHLNMREYKCDGCSKCFNTHKDLRSHKLMVHTDPQLWKYLCEICSKRFPIKTNYDCHMRRHTGDKRFECHLCHRKFTDKCVLQRHMRSHSNVREFKCDHCGKEYKDKRVLQIHMAKVHGIGVGDITLPKRERRYPCHLCSKAFYAKNKLTRHMYTHTGEKPFLCNLCDKKFNDKSYLKQHIRKAHIIDSSL